MPGPETDSTDHFPAWPVLVARLTQNVWTSKVQATLELPDGQAQDIQAPNMAEAREQVIDAVRTYLRSDVRHSGRLRVLEPDAEWLLGIPLDPDAAVVDLSPTAAVPAAIPSLPRSQNRSAPISSTPTLTRPVLAAGRTRRSRDRRPLIARLLVALALLVVVAAFVVVILDDTHHSATRSRTTTRVSERPKTARTPTSGASTVTYPKLTQTAPADHATAKRHHHPRKHAAAPTTSRAATQSSTHTVTHPAAASATHSTSSTPTVTHTPTATPSVVAPPAPTPTPTPAPTPAPKTLTSPPSSSGPPPL
jgi:hypothetical protein